MKKITNNQSGFTLLEILLVVAAISILAGIVIVALNPAKQLGDTRNAERSSDVNTIANAIHQYTIDNGGVLPASLDTDANTYQVLGTAAAGASCSAVSVEAAAADLSDELVPVFVVGIPTDPSVGTDANTGYYVNSDDNGRITVGACEAERSATIVVN